MNARLSNSLALLAAFSAFLLIGARGLAQTLDASETPEELKGVGITEHLDEKIPLDLAFKDESGKDVKLRDYFKPGHPVILVPGYYRCPMLCNLTRNGLVGAMTELEWSAGTQFTVLFVSINPDETPDLADIKKQAYMTQYRRDGAEGGLHFLVGNQREIELLTSATGFGYKFDPQSGEYAHTSTIMFLTPDGRLSRYMNDVQFKPHDLKLALIEASEGAIGSPMDKFLLFMCYQYDPNRNSYAASAQKIMRLGGAVTGITLLTGLGILWLREGKRRIAGGNSGGNSLTNPLLASTTESEASR